MADGTKIEWADATLNYVNGCSLESPGCTNCYAMKQAHRFPVRQGLTVQSKGGMVWTGEVRDNPKALEQAIAWKRPRAIFWNAHGDLFHPDVPDEWIDRQFATFALTPQHRHMLLTKRSQRMLEYVTSRRALNGNIGGAAVEMALAATRERSGGVTTTYPAAAAKFRDEVIERIYAGLPNVWLGVSVEDQERADQRIPDLLATPAAVRFISAEPLLGPVDLYRAGGLVHHSGGQIYGSDETLDGWEEAKIDWVIAGGESGPKARPVHPDWARSLRDQCAAAGVAFHFKQWGEFEPYKPDRHDHTRFDPTLVGRHVLDAGEDPGPENIMIPVGKKRAGRLLDGVEHNGVPAHG